MINLLPVENNEVVKAKIENSNDLDVLFYLFPHSEITVYAEGNNNYLVIIKADNVI